MISSTFLDFYSTFSVALWIKAAIHRGLFAKPTETAKARFLQARRHSSRPTKASKQWKHVIYSTYEVSANHHHHHFWLAPLREQRHSQPTICRSRPLAKGWLDDWLAGTFSTNRLYHAISAEEINPI